ncbi:MAG: hypothetical protein Q8K86_00205 [Candidatus Nanopelagicaceae bacterium]|nr:hypothetical protein [Candidatus Nanopelagicaceae bacterium]
MPLDHKEVQEMIDRHQASCGKGLETCFGHINGSLTSLHNKMDSIVTTVNKAAVNAGKVEERLEHGIKHFELLDKQVADLQEEDRSIWLTIGKVAIWIAAGAGGGIGIGQFLKG